jgi:hypothetical protein
VNARDPEGIEFNLDCTDCYPFIFTFPYHYQDAEVVLS